MLFISLINSNCSCISSIEASEIGLCRILKDFEISTSLCFSFTIYSLGIAFAPEKFTAQRIIPSRTSAP